MATVAKQININPTPSTRTMTRKTVPVESAVVKVNSCFPGLSSVSFFAAK